MQAKLLELRDRATFMPVVATSIWDGAGSAEEAEAERYLIRRRGFTQGERYVLLHHLESGERVHYDPYAWKGEPTGMSRTMHVAHRYILEHWDHLSSGDVVDVEFILGETSQPKCPEKEGSC